MNHPALLPSGLMDVLPPTAAGEFRLIQQFLRTFIGFGYQPVIPPMAEYAESLLAGQGEATGHHVFHFNDPIAPQLLAIRADITGQVVRIATTSLAKALRPLRLCYAGYTLRTKAEALKTRRQHTQVGIERFGDTGPREIAEVLAIACHALKHASLDTLTLDLHFPSVLQSLLKDMPADMHEAVRDAVRLKDSAQLYRLKADIIAELLELSGPAQEVLAKLEQQKNPALSEATLALRALVQALQPHKLNATITIDLLDLTGYGYYTGIGYTIYWNTPGIEVGRGGCYEVTGGEQAVGFTLYINELLDKLAPEAVTPIKKIPYGTPPEDAELLQRQGFITVFSD